MRAFADKLLDLTEHQAEEIAKRWCKSVRTNSRTPSYHTLPEEKCLPQAVSFYKNLKRLYFSEKPYQEVWLYFSRFAEERHAEGIPLYEAVYALIMMRRHIWLYAEFQALFMTAVDMHQAIDSINRVILLFDHAMYILTQKCNELTRRQFAEELWKERFTY